MPRTSATLALCLLLAACHAHSAPQPHTSGAPGASHSGTRESTNAAQANSEPLPQAKPGFPWTPTTTYADPAHGVTFRYPAAFKPTTQFSYIPPLLKQSETVKPVAGFGYSLGGFPRTDFSGAYANTNLEGFGIAYAAVESANQKTCRATADSIAQLAPNAEPPAHETINGRPFLVYPTGQEDMMKRLFGSLYATWTNRTCYLVETETGTVSPGVVDGVDSLTPQQSAAIDAGLLRIVHSLLIAQR